MYLTENQSIFFLQLICSKNRISPRLSEFGSNQLYFQSWADDEKSFLGTSSHFLDVRFGLYGAFYPRKQIATDLHFTLESRSVAFSDDAAWVWLCNKTTFHIMEYADF